MAALESAVGWDAPSSDFVHPAVLDSSLARDEALTAPSKPLERRDAAALVDIVIPTIRDLGGFLTAWRPFIEPFHLILVQDGDPDKEVHIPEWADFELYNRRDIELALGTDAWIISKRDASIRNFGFLVSEKRFVYTIDDDCLPVTKSSPISMTKPNAMPPDAVGAVGAVGASASGSASGSGDAVDAIAEHLHNLLSPATPYFFNTVYDPYRDGADLGFPALYYQYGYCRILNKTTNVGTV